MTERTDRELLELAARAAGLLVWAGQWPQDNMLFASPKKPDPSGKVTGVEWNPLTDDGDALRLAVKLNMRLVITGEVGITDVTTAEGKWLFGGEPHFPDPYAATRRAIVRAAAELGAKT